MAGDDDVRGPRMYARVMVDTSYDLEQKPGIMDTVRLSKGESLEVLEFHSDDWWKVRRCHDGKVMFAPPAYLELDYSRQDSLERRASSLESPKSSQEGDHSKGSKDTLDDDTPPEPLERDYPQPQPLPHQQLNSSQHHHSQSAQPHQPQQQQPQQQQPHHSQPQPPPRGSLRQQQTTQQTTAVLSHAQQTTPGSTMTAASTVTKSPSSSGAGGARGAGDAAAVASSCSVPRTTGQSSQQSDVILLSSVGSNGSGAGGCTPNKTQPGGSPGAGAVSAKRVAVTGVRHSHSSPPNSLFAQASLEVHPADDNDIDVDSSPSPGCAAGNGSGGGGPFERRFRMSLDEALRQRREKMGEVLDDDSGPRSDEDSLIEHQQTGSDLDEGDEGELVSNSPTGLHYSIASSKTPNASNPLQLPPRTGPIQRGHSAPLRPRSEGHHPQPIYANVQQSQGGGSVVVVHGHHNPAGEERPSHADFLEGDQLSAPLDLALTTTPPFPSPNEDPVRYLSDHWGEYRSTAGRPYYYNYVTGEHSWKPPRTRRKFSSQRLAQSVDSVDGLEALDGPDVTDTGLDSSVEGIIPSPPPSPTEPIASGWSKVYDDISGSMYFTNELNDERWCSSQDRCGRVYFYQEGTQRTAWELPKVAPCPPQRLKVGRRN